MDVPRTIHDFGGFPQELFDKQYPAPGAPGYAEKTIALVRNADRIRIDAEEGTIEIGVAARELERRRKALRATSREALSGALEKYAALVGSAFCGAVTHRGGFQKKASVSSAKRATVWRGKDFSAR